MIHNDVQWSHFDLEHKQQNGIVKIFIRLLKNITYNFIYCINNSFIKIIKYPINCENYRCDFVDQKMDYSNNNEIRLKIPFSTSYLLLFLDLL